MGMMNRRWMIRRDLPEVMEIEFKTENCLSSTDVANLIADRTNIGKVVEYKELGQSLVVGFMIYRLNRDHFDIIHLAVHPDWQRKGVGSFLTSYLTEKLSPGRRTYVGIEVRESNLAGQLFLKKLGFRCTEIYPNFYEDELIPDEFQTENAYHFTYEMEKNDGNHQRSELPGEGSRIDSASAG